ncbi:uncharacterized protein LOC115624920 [Scaptodrosophila lebanonensis]|uniref:Uncharacterized protein LOC115624920 n=1 Tax=Drosophila lebanonensis TaxID=7225 RepID=A0A6J2TJJ5_DROLE|nr:uncharacterized protein LOC115624920 [Scaptodrosophila lebanonensis]
MARHQFSRSLLLLAALVTLLATCGAVAPTRLRYSRQRLMRPFARQQLPENAVPPTPYPSASELKPEVPFDAEASEAAEKVSVEAEPALIYGPPIDDPLPVENEEPSLVDIEEIDSEDVSVESTTPAVAVPARLRQNLQRLAKLQMAKRQRHQQQRAARLEEGEAPPVAVSPSFLVAPAPAISPVANPVPQFYYFAAPQQLQQQLTW